MSKRGPANFAERGLTRFLAGDVPERIRTAISDAAKQASPMELLPAARRALSCVNQIYDARGFHALAESELCDVHACAEETTSWKLSWVDRNNRGQWQSASFIVPTSVGFWRVVIDWKCKIMGAFPVVTVRDSTTLQAPATRSTRSNPWDPARYNQEQRKLRDLGWALRKGRQELHAFCAWDYNESLRQPAWRACQRLRELCWTVDQQLYEDLSWQNGEGWSAWADRVLAVIDVACNIQECVMPVGALYFSHAAISVKFRQGCGAGRDLETLVEDLRLGRVNPLTHDDLVLQAVRFENKPHSLNNRRLWALQQHQLMLLESDREVKVRVKVLPWSDDRTVERFMKAFDTDTKGEVIRCRTTLAGAPLDGVIATTLGRASATAASRASELHRERRILDSREQQEHLQQQAPSLKVGCDDLRLGDERFTAIKDARERVQGILRGFSGGQHVPAAEFRLLLDAFQYHPAAAKKRISEVVSVTVGSSERFPASPCFWIWREDGSGEDISMNKCWKNMSAIHEAILHRNDGRRITLAGGKRFEGQLQKWFGRYGFVTIEKLPGITDHHLVLTGRAEYVIAGQSMIWHQLQEAVGSVGQPDMAVSTMYIQSEVCCDTIGALGTKISHLRGWSDINISFAEVQPGLVRTHVEGPSSVVFAALREIADLVREGSPARCQSEVQGIQLQTSLTEDKARILLDRRQGQLRHIRAQVECDVQVAWPHEYYEGSVHLRVGQQLYLELADIAKESCSEAAFSSPSNVELGTRFSFRIYKWGENGKYGCEDARRLWSQSSEPCRRDDQSRFA